MLMRIAGNIDVLTGDSESKSRLKCTNGSLKYTMLCNNLTFKAVLPQIDRAR